MTPMISAGLGSAGLAEKITARYRVQADTASTPNGGGAQTAASATRASASASAAASREQGRGSTLDLSV